MSSTATSHFEQRQAARGGGEIATDCGLEADLFTAVPELVSSL